VATEKNNRDLAMFAFGYGGKKKTRNILDRIRDRVLK